MDLHHIGTEVGAKRESQQRRSSPRRSRRGRRVIDGGVALVGVALAFLVYAQAALGTQQTRPAGQPSRPVLRPSKAPAPAKAPQVTSKTLQDGQARRQAAAAIPGPGKVQPTAAAGTPIPKDANVQQAIAHRRAELAKRGQPTP